MKRQPTWDKYEVALLIDSYIKIENGIGSKLDTLQDLSNKLRKKAINEGLQIDETFRNLNGMQWQMGFIDRAFNKTGYGSHLPSKLFQEMAELYQTNRTFFNNVLMEANDKIIDQISALDSITIDKRLEYEEEDEMNKCKEDYAKWLKNKKIKYSITAIIAIQDECSEYAITHKLSQKSLWEIENSRIFDNITKKLLNIRIYRVLHKRSAQIFDKTRLYYKDYLHEKAQDVIALNDVKQKKIIETSEENIDTTHLKEIGEEFCKYEDKIINILAQNFAYGFRLDSPIEFMKFREFAKSEGIEIRESDDELDKKIRKIGFISKGKLYVLVDEAKQELNIVIENVISQGISVISYEKFMTNHSEWIEKMHIATEDVLKDFLSKARKDLFYSKNFVSFNAKINEDIAVVNEIYRVWTEETILSVEEISDRLPYVPNEKIRFYLSLSRCFAWVSEGVYTRVDNLVITPEEEADIVRFIEKECELNGFASLNDMPLGDIVEQNYELSETTILIAVYNKLLSEDFYLNGKIVTKEKSDIDTVKLMKEYCSDKDECTLDEAINKVEELTGSKDRRIAYAALYDMMLRIDSEKFIADRFVNFDIEATDEAIAQFISDGFAAIKDITTFALFPLCGQSWNHYFLESYCYRYSKKFSFRTNLYNGRNAGAIVDETVDFDYKELLSRAAAGAKINLTNEQIGQYLFEAGYMARSKFSWLDNITERAKEIREE